MSADAVGLYDEVFASIPEEMGAVLERSAYSPNIKERRDYSCAIFDARGRLIAQASHIPVHLGAMPLLARHLAGRFEWREGMGALTNDPYQAGTHLPDWTLFSPVFASGDLVGFVANRAHHADTGGKSPGSMAPSRELFEEGLVIPPTVLLEDWSPRQEILDWILANVRGRDERLGDLQAQIGSNRIGVRRFQNLVEHIGIAECDRRIDVLLDYSARLAEAVVNDLAPGVYSFEDFLDDDGAGRERIRIALTLTIHDGRLTFDFTASDDQAASLNATEAVTRSVCCYALRALMPAESPTNEGCWRPVEVALRPGSVVCAAYPAAVAGGNVETSQRLTDVVLGALAQAAPGRIPAASQGTMNNLLIGGWDPFRQRDYAYYETIGGGCGAGPGWNGASGIHCHMTNTRNTPAEALEAELPLVVEEYRLKRDSGGDGQCKGGDGVIKRIRFLAPARVTLFGDRRRSSPYGLAGGMNGSPGGQRLIRGNETIELPAKGEADVQTGDLLIIETPSGGGYGPKV
ncbi:MAG: hydantoinase B/oxoprolinase family protein [Armatimonadetes bacterium]|nr:hydantoinase B/oxoprolinase family protein [Armatimonadota bacterium]